MINKPAIHCRSVEGGNVSSRQPITPSDDSDHSPDGEDSLNDYINRLENLQIRLGRGLWHFILSHLIECPHQKSKKKQK